MGFDGEAGGVRKAEGVVGAAGAEEGVGTGEAADVEDALKKAKEANGGGADEENGEEAGF